MKKSIKALLETESLIFNNLSIKHWVVPVLFCAHFGESVFVFPKISYLCNGGKFYGRKKVRK